jgi:predicted nucleotidyltransferase
VAGDLDALLERFVRACLEVFGQGRVEGIVLHGSALKGGNIPGSPTSTSWSS